MILEPKKDLARQVHHAGFMLKDEDVDPIINLWRKQWRGPLEKVLPKGQNEESPPHHQVHDEVNEGGNR